MNRALLSAVVLLLVIVGFAAVLNYSAAPVDMMQVYANHEATVRSWRPALTRADFDRLRDGMSYREAVDALRSSGTEQGRSTVGDTTSVLYAWQSDNGATITAMFQNDRLITKAQAGLR